MAMPKTFLEGRVPGFLGAGVSLICLIAFGIEDFRLRKARRLGSPRETLHFFHTRIRGKDFKAAATALAHYPRALARHGKLSEIWTQCALWGPLEGRTPIFRIRPPTARNLTDDLAVLTVEIHVRYGPWGLIPLFGVFGLLAYAVASEKETVVLEKLCIRSRGRWYLVNGRPGDSFDKQLIRGIESEMGMPDSGEA